MQCITLMQSLVARIGLWIQSAERAIGRGEIGDWMLARADNCNQHCACWLVVTIHLWFTMFATLGRDDWTKAVHIFVLHTAMCWV